jgi:nitrate reductase (NAD(P)H)
MSEQEHFLPELICESQHFLSLTNDVGKHNIPPDLTRDLQPLIDEQDQFTPDNWIPRSPHLTRLTGAHPLNAEPELTTLFGAGLITPTQFHYVRNHGAVPKLDWDSHKLQVVDPERLCESATEFGMNEIAEMDWICIPVTLACDGNRRGEVNRIRRSSGFDWGACNLRGLDSR